MTQLVHETREREWQGAAPADSGLAWLDALRRAGRQRFAEVGFPQTTQEAWRLTNLGPLSRMQFDGGRRDVAAARAMLDRFSFGDRTGAELVFVNGHFSHELSSIHGLPHGLRVMDLARAARAEAQRVEPYLGKLIDITRHPLAALNTGALEDGALVHVSRGVSFDRPIHLLYLATADAAPTVSHPRTLVVAEDGSALAVVESYAGTSGAYFTNAVTELSIGADCRIDHNKLQQESPEAFHIAAMQVRVGCGSQFVSHSTTMGGNLTRNDLNVLMAGEYADATLNGLVLLDSSRHCDNHTLLDHAAANCPSHELYKHVLDGHSSAVFKGQILVRHGSQKTDSKQTSKTLLMSDDAMMNSQPALEIYADDVKCTHGSTIGPMDEEQVFYLRSRGVGLEAARHLLTYAFAADITRRIKVEPVRRTIEDFMAAQHGLPRDLRIADLGSHDEAAVNL